MQVIMMKARGLFKLYQKALVRRPYLIHAVQSGTLMGAGDVISQTLIENKSFKDINYKRTLQFSLIGFFFAGPTLRVWVGVLNQHIGSSGKTVALKKVLIDQFVFAPVFLFFILSAVGTMQGKSWDHVKSDMSTNYLDVMKSNYLLWPWVQIVNFYYVPLQYQVLIFQTVALFWNSYLSWKTNKDNVLQK